MSTAPRPLTLIDHDLMSACRHIGGIALGAELALQPPDIADLTHACQGLDAVLRERRAATAAAEVRQ